MAGQHRAALYLRVSTAEQATYAVRLIGDLWAQSWSLKAITQELNRMPVRTKRGWRCWYASTVRSVLENDHNMEAA